MIDTLTGLQDHLRAAPHEPRAVSAMLERVRDAGGFTSVLRSITEDAQTTQRVAELSYRHPNGFDRIVLIDDGFDRPKARLHLWWPDEPAAKEQIHNHAWDFNSILLSGTLRFQLYSPAREGVRKLHYRSLPPRHATTGYRLSCLGETSVVCSFDSLLGPGTIYALEHNALHRVSPVGDGVVATLVIHSPFTRQHSDILADTPMDERTETRVRHLSAAELRSKLATVLDVIAQ